MSSLQQRLIDLMRVGGCVGVGVTDAGAFETARSDLEAAVAEGRHGGMSFTFRAPEVSTDIRRSFPWARSLLVGAHPYVPQAGDPGAPRSGTARIARFATSDHYRPLRAVLSEAAGLLREKGFRAEVLADDNRLVDRAAAVRAGVAWWGKSTLVLVPGAGPWVLIGSVATDAALAPDTPMVRDCGTCDACIPACPTGAIIAPGVLDARRCLSALLQAPGVIPREYREAVGDRLYGCDDCLTACPPGHRRLGQETGEGGRVPVLELLRLPDHLLRTRHPHFFVPRNDGRWLRRNALVVLGNECDPAHVGVLAGYAGHRDPMLRAHAVWGLGRIEDARAAAVLRWTADQDPDAAVRAEAEMALGTLT